MKFLIRRASVDDNGETMDFSTVEEIMAFRKKVKNDIIFTDCYDALSDAYVPTILVYDDYIE